MLVTNTRLYEAHMNEYRRSLLGSKNQGTAQSSTAMNPYVAFPDSCAVSKPQPMILNVVQLDLSKQVEIGNLHEIPDSVKHGFKYKISNWYLRNISAIYKVEDNKGINYSDKRARVIDVCLAKYSQKVAQEMNVSSACYTGVKHALWASGVLDDYSDMPRGSAYKAANYFNAHPEKFERLDVEQKDLKNLQAGCIIVYQKNGFDGHVAITNGYGQEMSDCTDNMKWVERRKEGATFTVYRLTDGWQYDKTTKKLKFRPKQY